MHEDEEHKEPPLPPPAASAVTARSADFSKDATSFSAVNIENLLEILGCRLGFPDPPKSRNLHPEICHLPFLFFFLEAREASGEWRGAGQRESHGQELRRDRI